MDVTLAQVAEYHRKEISQLEAILETKSAPSVLQNAFGYVSPEQRAEADRKLSESIEFHKGALTAIVKAM